MQDSAGQTTRHVMSNIRVTIESPEKARVVSYVTVTIAETKGLPIQVPGGYRVGGIPRYLCKNPEGWKIQKRQFVDVFTFDN
ncbi:MAG: hypothetical protein CM1200mP9_12030 [Gammaproteobacteria bacterium]|nr:MAG: hypothetical protein CM1200mP9_12030 [Gammaproteobacteria bacterium]